MSKFPYLVPGTSHYIQQDPGFYTKRVVPFLAAQQTAGAEAPFNGDAINRVDPDVALGCLVCIPAKLTMASGHDAKFTRAIDHRENSAGDWAEYLTDDVTVKALDAGGAQLVDIGFAADLSGAKPEIRVRVTPDFSASGVDTVLFGGSLVLMGFDHNPPGGKDNYSY